MSSKAEVSELIVGLKAIALDVKAVLKDGKVDMADLAVLPMLLKQQADLVAAVQGLGLIKMNELKIADCVALVEELVAAGKEVAAA